MDPLEAAGLAVAAFAAGAVNAVAGGGSLISFPALLAAGYPSKAANVTNSVALWPGYVGGTIGYRRELAGQRTRVVQTLLPSCAGAVAGSAILLWTPQSAFDALVPWLILFACALLAFQGPLAGFAQRHRLGSRHSDHVPVTLHVSVFAMSVYGAYFGAGLGIMLLAVLAILLPDSLQQSNALKGLLSMVINAVAVVAFSLFGPVRWAPAAVMALAALAGGYLGVGVARRLGRTWLKVAVVSYGVLVAMVLLIG